MVTSPDWHAAASVRRAVRGAGSRCGVKLSLRAQVGCRLRLAACGRGMASVRVPVGKGNKVSLQGMVVMVGTSEGEAALRSTSKSIPVQEAA